MPQRESVNWRFPVTVMDVVMTGRCCKLGWFRRPGKKDREIVNVCLGRVGMWDYRSALMTELSGGQRQRVFVARALAQEANVLLLDEAFSGVDIGAQEELVEVLRALRDEGRIILLATHDLTNLAGRFDEVLCLNCHVCACGPSGPGVHLRGNGGDVRRPRCTTHNGRRAVERLHDRFLCRSA